MDPDLAQSADEDDADDADIARYLSRVRRAAQHLPRGRREWVVGQAGDRLADALEAGEGGRRTTAKVLAGFGEPRDIVLAVDGHVPGTEARWMEIVAVLLVLAGGVLWRPAWLVGVVLLWVSPAGAGRTSCWRPWSGPAACSQPAFS